jgi:streptomycin 6-kinase
MAFRQLAEMMQYWSAETQRDLSASSAIVDMGLVAAGLQLFNEVSTPSKSRDVLLATELHAGNVLRATRERWLVIDPEPFNGDPAYDATQHLLNCGQRLHADRHDSFAASPDY